MDSDCTTYCKSEVHGNLLCATLTKRGVSDEELCSYLDCACNACGKVRSSSGCTLLHMAASTGRTNVCQWLVQCKGSNINMKDVESGYSPLHRSIFYGKIHTAVQLIQLGANVNCIDFDNLTPFEHAMKDNLNKVSFSTTFPCQLYVWGSNSNYTLGTEKRCKVPEQLDEFHKKLPDLGVQQICLHKYHSIIVSSDGAVYSYGHGQGGRLGLNNESTVISPQKIPLIAPCIQASISRDHSLFLLDSGQVWVCGLNTYGVLGVRPPPSFLLVPKNLPNFKFPISGVCAARFHSVAWGPKGLYSWGLHGGQLGHDRINTPKIVFPKFVNVWPEVELKLVATSDGAIVVITEKGDIYVLHEYQCRKIASKQLNITKVVVHGGQLDSKVDNVLTEKGGKELKVVALTNVGNILLWQESSPQLIRCIFSNRPLIVTDIDLNHNQFVFVTKDGEGYLGDVKLRKKKSDNYIQNIGVTRPAFNDFLNKEDCHIVKVTRLPNIHRAVCISTDPKGMNFGVLQTDPKSFLVNIPEVSATEFTDQILTLLKEADTTDSIHDVVFQVSDMLFPAHRYVIAKSSETLLNVSQASTTDYITLTNITTKTFTQILQFMYSGSCDLLNPLSIEKFDSFKGKDPVRTLQEAAKRFGVTCLYKLLDNYVYSNGKAILRNNDRKVSIFEPKFQRFDFPELHDVEIIVKNDKKLMAHKCILAARLEYFNNLFATRWNENHVRTSIRLPVSLNVLEVILNYLYTDTFVSLSITEDLDFMCNILAISNELFIVRLKEMCEMVLASRLTLKNVINVLNIADFHNSAQLKQSCMEFICLNLTCLMENHSLEGLDSDILKELTEFYCTWNYVLSSRVITPYSYAPDDEIVLTAKDHQPNKVFTPESSKKRRSRRNVNQRIRLESRYSISDENSVLKEHSPEKISDILISSPENFVLNKNNNQVQIHFRGQEKAKLLMQYDEPIEETYTSLKNFKLNDFPELGISKPIVKNSINIPHQHQNSHKSISEPIKIKSTKISQKQRKKLSSLSESLAVSPTSPSQKNICPWNVSFPFESTSCSPKFSDIGSVEKESMADIIANEKKQKHNWTRMVSKPLIYTQMEDRAIADLHRFYSTDLAEDEIITIERIQAQAIAVPVWLK